jgi:hypothetical protein
LIRLAVPVSDTHLPSTVGLCSHHTYPIQIHSDDDEILEDPETASPDSAASSAAPAVPDAIGSYWYTCTFAEAVENDPEMEIIGTCGSVRPMRLPFLKEVCKKVPGAELHDLRVGCPETEAAFPKISCMEDACLLVIPPSYLESKGIRHTALKAEADTMPLDTKCYSRKHDGVVTKRSRANNCIADVAQEPDISNRKGTILSFSKLPELSKVRKEIGDLLGVQYASLFAETNRYCVGTKTGIGYHGDKERCVVVGIRIGGGVNPIAYQWSYKLQPVGDQMRFDIPEGSMYIMGAKAVGTDWKKQSIPTLRHAAGHVHYMPSPQQIIVEKLKKRAAACARKKACLRKEEAAASARGTVPPPPVV